MPNSEVQFLTLDEAIAIHQRLVERFGGPPGIRDMGLLESALYRPRTGYYADLIETAAALFESLLMNYAFIDGNERVAFFETDVFLRTSGLRIDADSEAAHAFLIGLLERGEANKTQLEGWLRGVVQPEVTGSI